MLKEYKLDEKDKAILRLLLKDARMPLTVIAPKVKLSHDAVRYRIAQLKEAGVIKSFVAVIDPGRIGLPIWGDVIFSLWNVTPHRYEEWVKYLKNHAFVAAVWNLSGRYEWFVEIYTPDLAQFNEIVNEIKMKFSDIIKDSETLFVLKEIKAEQLYPATYPGI